MNYKNYLKTVLLFLIVLAAVRFDYASNQVFEAEAFYKHDCKMVERYQVKLLLDENEAQFIDMEPSTTLKKIGDIAELDYITWHASQIRYDEEFSTVKFKCRIKTYKEVNGTGGDNDYHVVIEDLNDPNLTMVAEIPDPTCRKVKRSPYIENFKQTRKMIDDNTILGSRDDNGWWKVTNKVYTIYGVLFRDKRHGTQEYQLDNFVEIHPVLELTAN